MGVAFTYQAADYASALLALGYRGRAWPIEPDSVRYKVVFGLVQSYVRSGARAVNLIREASPASTLELLPEWEATLGLPDPCTVANPSTAQRQAAVLAKFVGAGGQSVPYFVSVAAALGYTITVKEFTPFRLGFSRFGDPLLGPGWENVWQVNAPQISVKYFRLGIGVFGDPFWSIDNTELECRLRTIKPAHTILNFVYS